MTALTLKLLPYLRYKFPGEFLILLDSAVNRVISFALLFFPASQDATHAVRTGIVCVEETGDDCAESTTWLRSLPGFIPESEDRYSFRPVNQSPAN